MFLTLSFSGLFCFTKNVFAQENTLLISEAAAGIKSASNEFVEIYNYGNSEINLKNEINLELVSSDGSITKKNINWTNTNIPSEGYFLFGSGAVGTDFDATYGGSLLTGSGGVLITNKDNSVLDKLTWDGLKTNESMERIEGNLSPNDRSAFFLQTSPDPRNSSFLGTSSSSNSSPKTNPPETAPVSAAPSPTTPPLPQPAQQKTYSKNIRINELLPNPLGSDKDNEFIELYNFDSDPIDLSGWKLEDKSKKTYTFPEITIPSKNYIVVYSQKSKIALNNSGEETLSLIDPAENIVSFVAYTGSKENYSYSFDGSGWQWSRKLTPGEKNLFDRPVKIKISQNGHIYKNLVAKFEAKISDPDHLLGDKPKFVWTFGDGHKSYLQKTKHKYEKTGNYSASLKVSNGKENATENFEVIVKNYPEQKVDIVSVVPNPKGKDTKTESLTIKNNSSKKIDLKNWSITAGTKKLVNHPIKKTITLKPGQSKKITSKYSSFTLNNTASKIELRNPADRSVSKVNYSFKGGVPEDAVYKKSGKKWQWTNLTETEPEEQKISVAPNRPEEISQEAATTTAPPTSEIAPIESINYSPVPKPEIRKEKQLRLAGLDRIKNFGYDNLNKVLGIQTVRADGDNNYVFTNSYPHKHWAIIFLEDIETKLNSLLNKLLLAI